jgi:hypothetical protein
MLRHRMSRTSSSGFGRQDATHRAAAKQKTRQDQPAWRAATFYSLVPGRPMTGLCDHRLGLDKGPKASYLGHCSNHTIVQPKMQARILSLAPERSQHPRRGQFPYGNAGVSVRAAIRQAGVTTSTRRWCHGSTTGYAPPPATSLDGASSVRKCHWELDWGDATHTGCAVHLDPDRRRARCLICGLLGAATAGLSPTSRRQLIRAHQRVVGRAST